MSIGTPHAVDLTLVVVHYHTPELARVAVEGLLQLARVERVALELVVVDNGSDERGRAVLRSLAQAPSVRLLEPGRNLGYAGAANLGLREGAGAVLGVMNPDVVVLPGCLRTLLAELAAGAGVAGPLFHWDEGRRMLIPPAEPRGRLVELLYTLGRFPRLAPIARRHWRRHARRHWLAREALPSTALIGALLTFRRDAWQVVGGFDEGYRLYFEETDWLVRAPLGGTALRVSAWRGSRSPLRSERGSRTACARVVRGVGAALPQSSLRSALVEAARAPRTCGSTCFRDASSGVLAVAQARVS